jgi:hypothetical protein
MTKVDTDYLEDVFENEYLPDDDSDYKCEYYRDGSVPSVFENENIILPDWSKGI